MSANITPYLEGGSFEPEQVKAMGRAFDTATRALQDRGQPPIVRELIAKRIIEIVKTGEYDPDKISVSALKAVGIYRDRE